MIVDVTGGRMPYQRAVTVAGSAAGPDPAFAIDLSDAPGALEVSRPGSPGVGEFGAGRRGRRW